MNWPVDPVTPTMSGWTMAGSTSTVRTLVTCKVEMTSNHSTYWLDDYARKELRLQLTCFLGAITVASFSKEDNAWEPAERVICNGLSYAWPSRLQHSLVNSRATVSQWDGDKRSLYGENSRRLAHSKQAINLWMSDICSTANGLNDAFAYANASLRPRNWRTWTNCSWCNLNSREDPCSVMIHKHKMRINIQKPYIITSRTNT